MSKNKVNIYPIYIILFLSFMIIMIILTVFLAIKFKPDEDNSYFSTRQEVDENINKILNNQKFLESKYNFYIVNGNEFIKLNRKANRYSSPIVINKDTFLFKINIKDNNKPIKADSVKLYLTRFADAKDDIDIGDLKYINGNFISPGIKFKKGDWKVLIQITIDDKNAYFEQRILYD